MTLAGCFICSVTWKRQAVSGLYGRYLICGYSMQLLGIALGEHARPEHVVMIGA